MLLLEALGAREHSGRNLAERYREHTGKSISWGTLYTAMRRLKESGWVDVRDDEDEDGRIRFFKLSSAGARALPHVHSLNNIFGEGVVA